MPPKANKNAVVDTKPKLLGRLGTGLRIGIVGLPNVGKSTFFNILTKSEAAAENFPFCTIDPNEARVPIPDRRWNYLCDLHKPAKEVPAFLNVVDIAGLVKGAHEGAGLGNAFLSNIDSCDAIYHMLRIFEDDDITHVEGAVDPVRDMEIINNELRLKDIEKVKKKMPELEKLYIRGNNKLLKNEYEAMTKAKEWLESGKQIRDGEWSEVEVEELNRTLFLTAKPHIYLCNMSEKHYLARKSKGVKPVKEWIDKNDPGALMIPYSAMFEQTIYDMDAEEKAAYLAEKKTASKLENIIVNGFSALGLQVFFTAGKDEVKAWTIKQGSTAPMAAGRIHTDFQKGFIMAEVMKFAEFEKAKTEAQCKADGNYRQQGKTYVVNDGDIIFFKFNTPQVKGSNNKAKK
jgi:obg-like ATPase 1